MIDVTLACEDANSKLVNVVTVAGEDRVGNNLLQILKLRFGQKTFVQTLSTRFGQDFEVEVQARFAAGVWPVFSADDMNSTLGSVVPWAMFRSASIA